MNIYGYKQGTEDLIEMEAITVQGTVEDIKEVSQFLKWVSEEMERHGDKFGHEHYNDYFKKTGAKNDIVACRLA